MSVRFGCVSVMVVVTVILASCQTSQVSSVRDRYVESWTERANSHSTEYTRLQGEITARQNELAKTLDGTTAIEWDTLSSSFEKYLVSVSVTAAAAARKDLASRFIDYMKSEPTAGLTDAWFQQQLTYLQQTYQASEKLNDELFSPDAVFDDEWSERVVRLAALQGAAQGAWEEMNTLYQQAYGFFGDSYAAERIDTERRQQTAAALMAFGSYMNQLNYQQQVIRSLNRPRTCTGSGNSTTCF